MQNYKNTGSERVNTKSQSLGGYPGVNVYVCSNLIPPWAGIRKRGLWEVARARRLDTSLRAPVPIQDPKGVAVLSWTSWPLELRTCS